MRHNGRPVSGLPLDDRGWSLGDALFETILVRDARAIWLDEHLARLQNGCTRLALSYPAELRHEIDTLLRCEPMRYGVLRICLSRQSAGQRGYAPATRQCHRYLQLSGSQMPPRQHWVQGVRSFIADTRLPAQRQLAGIKHTNRLPHILARAERRPAEFPEGIMQLESGEVVEGIASNLFIVRKDELLTPRLDRAGVAGIVRDKVMATARGLGIPVRECQLKLTDVFRAEEVFFCNSLIGLWPVTQLDCFHYAGAAMCQKLQQTLESVWYG